MCLPVFFDYVVVPLVEVLSEEKLNNFVAVNGGGLNVDPLDTDKIAEAIEKVYLDQSLYSRLRKEGIAMVRNKYNWENQEKTLLQAYATMIGKNTMNQEEKQ